MIVTIKTDKLKVGMFVDLSRSWLENPFWKDRLMITSKDQIKKLINAGIKEVNVDTSRCNIVVDDSNRAVEDAPMGQATRDVPDKVIIDKRQEGQVVDNAGVSKEKGEFIISPPSKWEPERFMPKEIVEAVKDNTLPPEKRAKAVYKYSIEMMKHVLEHPTTETITATKEGIAQMVDVIVSDDGTASNLFKIVSHDYYTYTHSVNVGVKSILLAKALYGKSDKHNMRELGAGFFLHDLGKVKIDPAIINKRGKLTEEEMNVMRTHPYQGYKILSQVKQLSAEVWIIAMQHHEREDGTGYPQGLSGNAIHDYARICYIADVYDALTAERSYKKKLPPLEALRIMKEEMLSHFNREIFTKFVSLFRKK